MVMRCTRGPRSLGMDIDMVSPPLRAGRLLRRAAGLGALLSRGWLVTHDVAQHHLGRGLDSGRAEGHRIIVPAVALLVAATYMLRTVERAHVFAKEGLLLG